MIVICAQQFCRYKYNCKRSRLSPARECFGAAYNRKMASLTRRALVAGAASLAAAPAPEVKLPRTLRLGIIGFDGHPGEIITPLPQLPQIEVVSIADANQEARARAAKNPRITSAKQYGDYRQMLDREKLDLVAVCNNNGERAEAIIACAERKLDVIAEKPLAITRASFNRVRQTVDRNGIKLGMLLPMRFDSPYMALKKVVDDGLIGEVAQIGSQKSYKTGARAAWFLNKSTYGGTILWIGIHMIDLMRFASGREFREAAGFQGHVAFPELRDMENITASLFRLDNGGVATLRMDYLRPAGATTHGDDRLRLAGTKGVVEYQAATGIVLMAGDQKPRTIDNLQPKKSVFVDFLESSYNGKPSGLSLADIYRVNEIVLAAQEAAEQGKVVKI